MKNQDKKVREPVKKGDDKGRIDTKAIRAAIGRNIKLDSSWFEDRYPSKAFKWIVDRDNDLEAWLAMGAEHQIEERPHSKHKGQPVKVFAGTDKNGNKEEQYLLVLDKELDDAIQQVKREDAHAPMKNMMAKAKAGQTDDAVQGVETYAPETITGDKGMGMGLGTAIPVFNQTPST